jgi:hypothetical protein
VPFAVFGDGASLFKLIKHCRLSLAFQAFQAYQTLSTFPEFPRGEVTTISVSNFTESYPGFTANREGKVTVTNPSQMKPKFEQIKTWVYYDKDFLLASAFLQPFSLKAGKSKEMQVKYRHRKDGEMVGRKNGQGKGK